MVRLYMMLNFGYYITESSEHLSNFIKSTYPHLVEEFNIPLDEYPRRCVNQIARWKDQKKSLRGANLTHKRTRSAARTSWRPSLPANPLSSAATCSTTA